jgi:hypothetical protein
MLIITKFTILYYILQLFCKWYAWQWQSNTHIQKGMLQMKWGNIQATCSSTFLTTHPTWMKLKPTQEPYVTTSLLQMQCAILLHFYYLVGSVSCYYNIVPRCLLADHVHTTQCNWMVYIYCLNFVQLPSIQSGILWVKMSLEETTSNKRLMNVRMNNVTQQHGTASFPLY